MRLFHMLAALLLSVALGQTSLAQTAAKSSVPTGQLPKTAEPLAYKLHFTLDPASPGFTGQAEVQVRLLAAADHVWLHGRGLDVQSVTLAAAGAPAAPARYSQVNADGVARVDFGRVLKAQDITLTFNYSGPYSTNLEGIYKVTRGADSYLMTQHESIGARRSFPGFDEPRFKTPFAISFTMPTQLKGFANTEQTGEQVSGANRTLQFATTEKLPTYLVAFAVGPWEVSALSSVPPSAVRSTPLPLRIIGPKGTGGKLGYALANTPAIVLGLEDYFGIAYPFSKLDSIAVPDFAFGAMENPGLIVYNNALLLVDEKSSVGAINRFREVNTHELAHQWFGNLVTPYWWNDIWLNEAFATWNAAKITSKLYPDSPFALMQLRGTQAAMGEDSLISARRIREPVNNTGDIEAAFDGITYQKGAGVLATFENWIGEEAFRKGVQAYMAKHARKAAKADDLIDALATSSGKGAKFSAAFKSFLDQPGLPLVTVTPQCTATNGGKASVRLQQSRFLPLGSPGREPGAAQTTYAGKGWQVPVCLRLGNSAGTSTQRCELLDKPEKTIALDQCPAWILPNANAGGYYRFTLPPADLKALLAALPTLTPPEQLAVLDAVSAAFALGKVDANAVLTAAAASAESPYSVVVSKLWERIDFLRDHVLDAAGRDALRTRLGQIYQASIARLGVAPKPGESEHDAELRARLLAFLAVDWQVPAVQEPLLALAKAALDAPSERLALSALSENVLAPALTVWARDSAAAHAPRLQAELAQNQIPAQRRAILTALASIPEASIAGPVRDLALATSLQLRERTEVLRTQAARHVLDESFWPWYQANFAKLLAGMPGMAQRQLVDIGTRGRCSASSAAELQSFLKPQLDTITSGPRAMQQASEGIALCAALAAHHAGSKIAATTPN